MSADLRFPAFSSSGAAFSSALMLGLTGLQLRCRASKSNQANPIPLLVELGREVT